MKMFLAKHDLFIQLVLENVFHSISFDVRLMQEGRMKGQAFVSFANEKSAERALRETHRYLLFGKPLVVVSVIALFNCLY
jgi:RNA recognition motif-containing protein